MTIVSMNSEIRCAINLSKQLDIDMSKKANVIEAKGVIFKESGNGYFNVELDEPIHSAPESLKGLNLSNK